MIMYDWNVNKKKKKEKKKTSKSKKRIAFCSLGNRVSEPRLEDRGIDYCTGYRHSGNAEYSTKSSFHLRPLFSPYDGIRGSLKYCAMPQPCCDWFICGVDSPVMELAMLSQSSNTTGAGKYSKSITVPAGSGIAD